MTKSETILLFLVCLVSAAFPGATSHGHGQDQVTLKQEPEYQIEVSTRRALVDEIVQIRVVGLTAGQRITLSAEVEDPPGSLWQSSATFEANTEGIVDVTEQAPTAGSYGAVDPMGLFWSMSRVEWTDDDESRLPVVVEPVEPGEPLTVTLEAEVEGQPVVSAVVERLFADADVVRHPVREEGLVGALFVPPGAGPRAAVLVLHGGSCLPDERKAALIAAHGFVTLALQWCGAEGQPDRRTIEPGGVPLEYFGKAVDWLKQREEVAGAKLGVVGVSLGTEAALLAGAHFPDIRAVVSIKGGGVVFGNRWTLRGEPIPHVTPDAPDRLVWAFWSDQPDECWPSGLSSSLVYRRMMGEPIDLPAGQRISCVNTESRYVNYLLFKAFADPESLARAVIPVERINGPVLLVSGHADRVWPSTLFSEIVINRLQTNNHPFVFEHLAFPGAGHRISNPYLPTTLGRGGWLLMGGDAEGAALANEVYWPRMLEFLRTSLKGVNGS
jgi:pimeloyl-ACP methyl ester carboxylesterase